MLYTVVDIAMECCSFDSFHSN